METNWNGVGTTTDSGTALGGGLPGILDMMIDQVRAYEDEYGLVEPLDPRDARTGGYALSGLLEQRIAAIKGVLVASGQGGRLVRLDVDPDIAVAAPEALLRGVTLRPNPTVV